MGRFSATESHNSTSTLHGNLHPAGSGDYCFMDGPDCAPNSANRSPRALHASWHWTSACTGIVLSSSGDSLLNAIQSLVFHGVAVPVAATFAESLLISN
jgi:hypothetical protein